MYRNISNSVNKLPQVRLTTKSFNRVLSTTNTAPFFRVYNAPINTSKILLANKSTILISSTGNSLRSLRHAKNPFQYRSFTTAFSSYQQNDKELRQSFKEVNEVVLDQVPKIDVKKVLVVGSGGLSIGQAGEFDYSGNMDF